MKHRSLRARQALGRWLIQLGERLVATPQLPLQRVTPRREPCDGAWPGSLADWSVSDLRQINFLTWKS